MQRSLAKKFVSVGTTSVISIVLVDRTLDFEIEEVSIEFGMCSNRHYTFLRRL